MSLSLYSWYPGSGVVHDCIDSIPDLCILTYFKSMVSWVNKMYYMTIDITSCIKIDKTTIYTSGFHEMYRHVMTPIKCCVHNDKILYLHAKHMISK